MAVPALRQWRSGMRGCREASISRSPSGATPFQMRLAPSSHRMGVRVVRSAIRNLYSLPFGKAGVVERDDPLPVVEAVGGDGQRFVGPQCRNGHPEGRLCGGFVFPAALCGRPCCPASEDAAGVGHRAERCVGADILPAVVDPQRPAVGELRGAERVGIPFGTDLRIVAFDRIAVFELLRSGAQLDTGVPDAVVGVPHGDFPFPEQQDELFAPAGTVFDVEIEFHRLVGLCRLDLVLSTQK